MSFNLRNYSIKNQRNLKGQEYKDESLISTIDDILLLM